MTAREGGICDAFEIVKRVAAFHPLPSILNPSTYFAALVAEGVEDGFRYLSHQASQRS
jgi:hypothetical protein